MLYWQIQVVLVDFESFRLSILFYPVNWPEWLGSTDHFRFFKGLLAFYSSTVLPFSPYGIRKVRGTKCFVPYEHGSYRYFCQNWIWSVRGTKITVLVRILIRGTARFPSTIPSCSQFLFHLECLTSVQTFYLVVESVHSGFAHHRLFYHCLDHHLTLVQ